MKFIIYKNIKDKKLRQDMLEILKILTLESVKFKKGVDKENLNKILTILNNSKFNKEWKRNVIKIIKELQNFSIYKNKSTIKLKKLFFSYSETKKEANLNFIFEFYLKASNFPDAFDALHHIISYSYFDPEWLNFCKILGTGRFLNYYIGYNTIHVQNENENTKQYTSIAKKKFSLKSCFNWIIKYYHIYLDCKEPLISIKRVHHLLSYSEDFYGTINLVLMGVTFESFETMKILKKILKRTYQKSDIINNRLVKDANPIQKLQNNVKNLSLFVLELEDSKIINVLSHKDSKFKKVIFKYPIK